MKMMRQRTYPVLILTMFLLGTILIFVFIADTQQKPTIHALLVIMDGDPVNSEQYKANKKLLTNLLRRVENKGTCELKLTILNSDTATDAKQPTPARVLDWIDTLNPLRNDVVFLYYCGHGGRAGGAPEGGTYFDLDGAELFRKAVVDKLRSSRTWACRLKMLITDTCAVETMNIEAPENIVGTSASASYRAERAYRHLFVEHEGFLHLTSATENEYSWGDSTNGGWFTNGLVASINSHADATGRFVGWNEIFTVTEKKVAKFIAEHKYEVSGKIQHPKKYGEFPKALRSLSDLAKWTDGNDSSIPPKARVQKIWVDHNQFEDEVKGMRIHVKFDVDHFKGHKGRVSAYFYKKNGDALKDFNESYRTTGGMVSVGKNFTPSYVNAIYNDFKLFMPYQELHVRGKHDLKFRARVFSEGNTAISPSSDWIHFTYTAPEAHIQRVWVDHNQFEDEVKGMRIHVKFDVDHFKGHKGRVSAYFYKKNGDALKDFNESYRTTGGMVSVGKNFTPSYVNAIYNDFKLFMPYKELHMVSGKHSLKFYVLLYNSDTSTNLSDQSDWVYFTYTK